MPGVAVSVGGIYVGSRYEDDDNAVCWELKGVNLEVNYPAKDYVVDLCFKTYVLGGLMSEVAGTGIHAMKVIRRQRRLIVGIEVPPELGDLDDYRLWMLATLGELPPFIRGHAPARSKKFPLERLADEVDALRERWRDHLAGATT